MPLQPLDVAGATLCDVGGVGRHKACPYSTPAWLQVFAGRVGATLVVAQVKRRLGAPLVEIATLFM